MLRQKRESVAQPPAETTRPNNLLLAALSQADFALLRPGLTPLVLPVRHVIEDADKPIKHVYFLETGIASVVAVYAGAGQVEVGLIGREGMSGVVVVLGDHRSANSTYMQVAGSGFRIAADDLRAAMEQSATLRHSFLQFAQAFMIQTAQTAAANARASADQRLARWLLMAHDRLDGDALPLTHEFLALMLAVLRPGVTIALHRLKGKGLIRPERGRVILRDRKGLEALAGACYGVPEAEYRRLTDKQSHKTVRPRAKRPSRATR